MSRHFSKFALNTYQGTPYFKAFIPDDYPTSITLQRCRAFKRLPPNLRKLATLSKRWAARHDGYAVPDIDRWYDSSGYELNPDTGQRLTNAEINAEWGNPPSQMVHVYDIPVPHGGFPDPYTWEPKESPAPDVDDDDRPTREQLLRDIASHGAERVSDEYGIPVEELPTVDDAADEEPSSIRCEKCHKLWHGEFSASARCSCGSDCFECPFGSMSNAEGSQG